MTNFQVYRKTLGFSFIRFLADLFCVVLMAGGVVAGFFIGNGKSSGAGLIGAIIGLLISLILVFLVNFFIVNRIKAAQISMMTRGVTEDELPDHVVKTGFSDLKGRFGKIATFYLINRAIHGIFNQISRTLNRIGNAVGGSVGSSVTGAINSAVETVIAYLCDCCLGWILFRKDVNPFRAGCEGCVIFFKHGKTLVRNVGRIFGMGLLSFVVIAGAFFGVSYAIFASFPQVVDQLIHEFVEIAATDGGVPPDFFMNPTKVTLVISAIIGLIFWMILHSVLVRPFILVGVLRNYMAAGIEDMPKESDFDAIAAKTPKFRKLQSKIE